MDCLFCKIIAGEIPAEIILEREQLIAFKDISPKAPTHILVIPRKHIATINDLDASDTNLVGKMVQTAKTIAHACNLADDGYRLVFNVNKFGGQVVFHIHLHLLGGRTLNWPPG